MDMTQVMSLMLKLVALVLFLIVTRYLVPWLDKKFQVAKNADIEFWTNTFVLAADQILGVHCGTNDEKYVLVKEMLSKTFPEMDPDFQNLVIEAAVKKLRALESKADDVDS